MEIVRSFQFEFFICNKKLAETAPGVKGRHIRKPETKKPFRNFC